jgi:hypothetical protein
MQHNMQTTMDKREGSERGLILFPFSRVFQSIHDAESLTFIHQIFAPMTAASNMHILIVGLKFGSLSSHLSLSHPL